MSDEARAAPPSDPSNGQLDRDGPVADVWDAASLRMSAENCRTRAESLNRLTGAGEDYIWRPADGARGTLLNVAVILDSIASTRAAPTPPADSPGGDRMGVEERPVDGPAEVLRAAFGKTTSALLTRKHARDIVAALAEDGMFVAAPSPPPAVERREQIARAVHKGRYPADREPEPWEEEDRSGQEYCLRIADRVLALPPQAAPGVVEALKECADAVDFFDRVHSASDDEKIAVGTDHWNRLEAACRQAAALSATRS